MIDYCKGCIHGKRFTCQSDDYLTEVGICPCAECLVNTMCLDICRDQVDYINNILESLKD